MGKKGNKTAFYYKFLKLIFYKLGFRHVVIGAVFLYFPHFNV